MLGGARPAAQRFAGRGPVLALCVAGAAIRFATLGQQSFWLDEAVTGRLMRLGFGGMLRAIPESESTPPLYYILAWVWTRAFGVNEVGVRSLSALLGTLTIGLLYAAGTMLFDRRAGLFAAALGAFAPVLIWYSQEARSYALLLALSAAGLWAFAAALEPRAGRRPVWLWAAAGGLALSTHYFAVFLVGPELGWLAWKLRRPALPASAVVVAVGVAALPLAIHQRANGGAGFIARTPLTTRVAQAAKQLAFGYDAPADTGLVVLGVLLGLAALGLLVRGLARLRPRVPLGLAGLGAAGLGLPVVLALSGDDYVITRNVVIAWLPAGLALAGVLAAGRRAGVVVCAGLCAVGLAVTIGVDLDVRYQRDDWRGAAAAVPRRTVSVIALTPSSGRVALQYYLPGSRLLGPAGARVASVEVIALGARGVGDAVRAPALPAVLPTIAGFGPGFATKHVTFTVVRYWALAGMPVVTPSMVSPLAPSPTGSTQLVTSAGRD